MIHRNTGGVNSWSGAENALIYGCIVHNVGYLAQDRPHGPGFYAQNLTDSPRHYDENIVAGSFSNPFQIYSKSQGGAALGSMYGSGNIIYGRRTIGTGPNSSACLFNVIFGDDAGINQHFTNNYLYGTQVRTGAFDAVNNEFANNHVIYSITTGCEACSESSNYVEPYLSKTEIHIRPNKYDPRRANMVVMNANRDSEISISLGDWADDGDYILVYNAVELTTNSEPVAYGIYNGSYFNLPMDGYTNPNIENAIYTDWSMDPNPKDIAKGDFSTVPREFGAFVLIKNPF
jgi:hypothetical protein